MFENLSDRFEKAFQRIKGEATITEANIAETTKEIRRALVEADVNYSVAKRFANRVKDKAVGQEVLTSVRPGQLLVKITQEELAEFMGGQHADLNLKGKPGVILMSGLQGSGKTTHTAKLALHLQSKQGKRPLLVACDVYRPAAIDQLEVMGKRVGADVFTLREEKNPVAIAEAAMRHARSHGNDVVIIDTAGRLAVDEDMMDEIARIKEAVQPSETLFVVDAMTGQDAVRTAQAFHERIAFDGVILTKMDGDTRGGAALSIREETGKPIKFIGTGEKPEALEPFHPDRMAQRILGMGDVVTLVEKAQEQFDEAQAKKLEKKIRKNSFDFEDFLEQVQQIKKMGNVKDLLAMVPGMGKALRGIDIDDDAFKHIEAIIRSMTPDERQHPEKLNGSRKTRIAKGSGTSVQEVNQLLKQFGEMKKMMKMMNAGGGRRRGLGGMMGRGAMPGGMRMPR
ncbi:MAG: signal recognition particle protein [Bacteroidota bacterium]|jgi:signal recognition particle subunit SRP54|nr:signal recognition particle protein [Bacteroidota bacterium]